MVFSSVVFLFYFLPTFLALYALTWLGWPQRITKVSRIRAGNAVLLGASCLFYAWGEPTLLWVMLTSTLVDYGCGRALHTLGERSTSQTALRRTVLILSIVTNLGFLAYFKYSGFFVESFSALAPDMAALQELATVALPIGISFYTFQSMSYTIDVYRGRIPATRNLLDFACYVTMFPQLVAGPIVRYTDVARQLVDRTLGRSDLVIGVQRFVIGLTKKVCVANVVAGGADAIFALPTSDLTPAVAWLGIVCYTLQIYFDFSGYSDMAIGLGRMLGFRYPENFDHPYAAASIKEFWRRWHISLSSWFRDYLYIPLGGSRRGPMRTYFSLLTVFFLCGLWHGASWNFVVWGLFHGGFLIFERLPLGRAVDALPSFGQRIYTLLVVIVGWVLFRADDLPTAVGYLGAMVGLSEGDAIRYPLMRFATPELAAVLIVGTIISLGWLRRFRHGVSLPPGLEPSLHRTWLGIAAVVLMLVATSLRLAAGTHNPFIYFRF